MSFGDYGLKALEPCWLTDRQIEAARVAMTRFIKRGGKIWVRVFPGQADHEEAAGNAHGQGQGRAGAVGGGDPAGPRAVRDGRRDRDGSARGDEAGGGEAADSDKFATRFAQEKML